MALRNDIRRKISFKTSFLCICGLKQSVRPSRNSKATSSSEPLVFVMRTVQPIREYPEHLGETTEVSDQMPET